MRGGPHQVDVTDQPGGRGQAVCRSCAWFRPTTVRARAIEQARAHRTDTQLSRR